MYRDRLKAVLEPSEARLLARLDSPAKIQDWLDTLPINFELRGETYMSVRRVIESGTAHCFEGALFAAAALAYHGGKPLLMDLRTTHHDEDHVVALYKVQGYWGAISKTNHPVLRYRDPVYPDIKSLALSYFHEYFMNDGRKTLREYSAPFDLSRFPPEKWISAGEELVDFVNALDGSRHFPLVPKKNHRRLRPASALEIRASALAEWRAKKHDGKGAR